MLLQLPPAQRASSPLAWDSGTYTLLQLKEIAVKTERVGLDDL